MEREMEKRYMTKGRSEKRLEHRGERGNNHFGARQRLRTRTVSPHMVGSKTSILMALLVGSGLPPTHGSAQGHPNEWHISCTEIRCFRFRTKRQCPLDGLARQFLKFYLWIIKSIHRFYTFWQEATCSDGDTFSMKFNNFQKQIWVDLTDCHNVPLCQRFITP